MEWHISLQRGWREEEWRSGRPEAGQGSDKHGDEDDHEGEGKWLDHGLR
jgi:hypothetical protein